MVPIKKLKSGSTSTFIPGGTGSSGTRAGVTFYGSKSQDAPTSNTITFRLNNENVTIYNQYGNILNPAKKDCIVYADTNITYLLSIADILEKNGLICSGTSPDGSLVEIVEIPEHKFFIAGQFHPEFKSRPDKPAPLFVEFVKAIVEE